jgi:peptidoglycan/xylan/chitin deacetylase (PgdA/CDA1 family)
MRLIRSATAFGRALVVSIVVASTVTVFAPNAGAIATQGYARTTDSLNLRTGPSTAYPIKLAIPCGARVYVLSGPDNTTWYRVSYGSNTGYVNGSYLVRRTARTVTLLPTTSNLVALTFDAGSDRGYAASILDTLKAKGVKASFGITGTWAAANPDLVVRMVQEGHGIINHSWSHPSFTGFSTATSPLTYRQRRYQLSATDSTIRSITGTPTKPWFRPPYGDFDTCARALLWHEGYRYNVMWSTDSGGWMGMSQSQILTRVMQGLRPGAIFIFHVGSASQDGPALATVIDQIRSGGYGFATVTGMLR